MKINRNHPRWKAAPVLIKVGAFGISTYEGVNKFAISSALIAMLAIFVGFFFLYVDYLELALYILMASSFGLAAYWYASVQIWLLQNGEVLCEAG